jgi:iduronate 2-sulfatase
MSMHKTIRFVLCSLLVVATASASGANKPNVLFIAVDDLRPQLGCYGHANMRTPNIDRLAKRGVVFNRSYCMVPTCGASRASLMTGVRPARNRFVSYQTRADKDAPNAVTLNTHFRSNGYYTVSNGKVFHHADDNAKGWSEPAWRPKTGSISYHRPENQALHLKRGKELGRRGRGPAYEAADAPDENYGDGMIARKAVEDLQRLSRRDEPFFLAVGFLKPHLPFVCPQKYWDLYPADSIKLPETYHRPKDAPDEAIHSFGEMRAYAGIPKKGPVSNETALNLIRGYYACVSFTDAQIGRVLDELDRLKLADDTIVVLWGDHGWNLGEHTLWCKHCCFETSMRAPLIVSAPGMQRGKITQGLTEFIDIYPSLCDLAGLEKPGHLEGRSFAPLLKNPAAKWKEFAIGRFGPGDTIRTDRHRFTEYRSRKDQPVARMLYDHDKDPDEDRNISELPVSAEAVEKLTRLLRENKGKPGKR